MVSPNSWDGSRQLIMILNYIYSNLDWYFFSVLVCSRIRDEEKQSCFLKNCNFLSFLFTSWGLLKKPAHFYVFRREARGEFHVPLRGD